MRILFIGDIVGKIGRKAVGEVLPGIKKKEKIDLVIANGENLAHGRGMTERTVSEVMDYGVDFFTSGPHIFTHPEIFSLDRPLIRPVNYPEGTVGRGWSVIEVNSEKALIINLAGVQGLLGRTFLEEGESIGNPFAVVEEALRAAGKVDLTIVDFHAEITSEKKAMGFFLDGRTTAVLGTHTHVPTSDVQILPKGTGYVTDVGMCGAKDSVLGVEPEIIIKRLSENARDPFEWVEKGPAVFNAVLLEVNSKGLAESMKRVDKEVKG